VSNHGTQRRRYVLEPVTLSAAMRDRATPPIQVHAPRRRDPTRTVLLRKQFERAAVERFRLLAEAILQQVDDADGFGLEPAGLKAASVREVLKINRPRFDFPRTDEKVAAFMRWLRAEQRQKILGVAEGVPMERAARSSWANVYIETAYQKGIADAGARLRAAGAKVADSWVAGAFNRPLHADRIGLIYTRVFSELEDVTEEMDRQISGVLARGLAEGKNPRELARIIVDRVEKIGEARARVIARTEVVAAHAEATLNAYDEAGVEGVELEAEWLTAGDELVCPLCEELEGRVFELDEARNMLPRHPNCRCAWRPKIIGGSGVVLNWVTRSTGHA
jgi:SPP1 gp7 family putative phage head morphogenesis protein